MVAEYDLFLADERIINLLPQVLGKTFYKSTAKRPVPVSLTGKANYHGANRKTGEGNLKRKRDKEAGGPEVVGQPFDVGADIQKTLDSTTIYLGPSVSTSVRVAWSGWPVEWIAENISATVEGIAAKYVPKGWRGVKSLHIKSPSSMAIPVWLSAEVWTDDQDVLNQDEPFIEDGFNKPKKEAVAIRLKAEHEQKALAMKVEEEEKVTAIKSKKQKKSSMADADDDDQPKPKKHKKSDTEPVDEEALARKKARKAKKEQKEKEAAALKLKESTMRKEDLAMQKRAAKKEAQLLAEGFKNPKPRKEKKVEVSEVASKKSAI